MMFLGGHLANARTSTNAPHNRGSVRAYFSGSREPFTAILLVVPLFLFYQLGVLLTGGMKNGVDFVTSTLFSLFHGDVLVYGAFNGVVLVGFSVALLFLRRSGAFHPRLFPWVLLESAVYALLFGSVVVALIQSFGLGSLLAAGQAPKSLGLFEKLVMSAGAGLYEEIVFRAVLMGGLFLLATRVLGIHRIAGAVLAVIASSLIFSAAHHLTEPFTVSAFVFRTVAGILFAGLFQVRGFAVAAYTHALYDVYVMVFRGG